MPFVLDCPHTACRASRVAVEVLHEHRVSSRADEIQAVAKCPVCERVIGLSLTAFATSVKAKYCSPEDFGERVQLDAIYPAPPQPGVPASIPDTIRAVLLESESALDRNSPILAATGLRTSVELAIKALSPTAKGPLYDRIEAMRSFVPDAMVDALHEVRFLGNDAAHEAAADLPEVVKGAEYVRLFMTYAFDLPARIASAKAARGKTS